MQLSEYKKGDRVKYVFLGDYEGKVINTHNGSVLTIMLDKRPPVEFNMGHLRVMALGPNYVELLEQEQIK